MAALLPAPGYADADPGAGGHLRLLRRHAPGGALRSASGAPASRCRRTPSPRRPFAPIPRRTQRPPEVRPFPKVKHLHPPLAQGPAANRRLPLPQFHCLLPFRCLRPRLYFGTSLDKRTTGTEVHPAVLRDYRPFTSPLSLINRRSVSRLYCLSHIRGRKQTRSFLSPLSKFSTNLRRTFNVRHLP